MYGYIVPQKSTLSMQDFVLYRSFYCGICCQIGKLYGQLPRITTSYDFTFLSALLHDAASADIVIEEHNCILNPVKKKAVLQPNPLHERIAAASIIMSYKKAEDGIKDGDGFKYDMYRRMLSRPYKKSVELYPDIAGAIDKAYEKIVDVEAQKPTSLDRAADPFATLLASLPEVIIGRTDDNLRGLCYNIGKFVYFADALDDLAEDNRKKRYNPFLAAFGEFKSRSQFISAHKSDIEFCLMSTYARAVDCFIRIRLTQSRSLLSNIVCEGMKAKAEELLGARKKLRPPRI